jgi:hypothetical protein
MKTVSERLAYYLKYKGKGQTAFEKDAGLSRGYVKHASDNMGSKIREKIKAQCPDLNMEWLLTGKGVMLTGNITQSDNGNNVGSGMVDSTIDNHVGIGGVDDKEEWGITPLGDVVTVLGDRPSISYTHGRPYYNVDFLGGFDIIINDQTVRPEYNIDFKPYNKDGVMWCNITGHSMEPLVSNGDIIAIKEMKSWRDFILYGEVYGIVTEDMRTIKVVTKSERGKDFMRLVPINKSEEYQPQDIPVRLITHVFKVVGCMKKMW